MQGETCKACGLNYAHNVMEDGHCVRCRPPDGDLYKSITIETAGVINKAFGLPHQAQFGYDKLKKAQEEGRIDNVTTLKGLRTLVEDLTGQWHKTITEAITYYSPEEGG